MKTKKIQKKSAPKAAKVTRAVPKHLVKVDPKVLEKVANRTAPPPPPKKIPPPPPPRPATSTPQPVHPKSVVHQLPQPRPNKATVVQFSRPSIERPDGTWTAPLVIVAPASNYGDFSSFTSGNGTLRWGYMRGPDEESDFVPVDAQGNPIVNEDGFPDRFTPPTPPARVPGAPPPPPAAPRQPRATGPKREGVCAFIDALIMEGTRTADAIRDLVLEKFPGRDPQATLSTVKTRPAHIKAKGQVPPPFKK